MTRASPWHFHPRHVATSTLHTVLTAKPRSSSGEGSPLLRRPRVAGRFGSSTAMVLFKSCSSFRSWAYLFKTCRFLGQLDTALFDTGQMYTGQFATHWTNQRHPPLACATLATSSRTVSIMEVLMHFTLLDTLRNKLGLWSIFASNLAKHIPNIEVWLCCPTFTSLGVHARRL